MGIFAKFADNGLCGCTAVVVVCERKMGLFRDALCAHTGPDCLEGLIQIWHVHRNTKIPVAIIFFEASSLRYVR